MRRVNLFVGRYIVYKSAELLRIHIKAYSEQNKQMQNKFMFCKWKTCSLLFQNTNELYMRKTICLEFLIISKM
jgi:hypothetical protein